MKHFEYCGNFCLYRMVQPNTDLSLITYFILFDRLKYMGVPKCQLGLMLDAYDEHS